MGYEYEYQKNGSATNCFPKNTDSTLWLAMYGDKNIAELIHAAKTKWPDVEFEDITIDAVNHHQYNIYYDLHDYSDYVQYLVLSVEE